MCCFEKVIEVCAVTIIFLEPDLNLLEHTVKLPCKLKLRRKRYYHLPAALHPHPVALAHVFSPVVRSILKVGSVARVGVNVCGSAPAVGHTTGPGVENAPLLIRGVAMLGIGAMFRVLAISHSVKASTKCFLPDATAASSVIP